MRSVLGVTTSWVRVYVHEDSIVRYNEATILRMSSKDCAAYMEREIRLTVSKP